MTLMIPAQMGPSTPHSERSFFVELRDDPATNDWTALHSLNLVRHHNKLEGECDMVVLVPNRGILIVEVKGVGVRRDQGRFFYEDNRPSDLGPFKQAAGARWSLFKDLRDIAPAFGKFLFWSVVIFPTVPFKERSTEWHDWQCINSDDLKRASYAQLLTGVLEKAHQFVAAAKNQGWYDAERSRPSKDQCRKIANVLRGNFNYVTSSPALIDEAERELMRFTQEQVEITQSIAENPRNVVKGPAGTGKTLMAMELFRANLAHGKSVLLVCFNRNLADKLQQDLKHEDLSGNLNAKVTTFHSFLTERIPVPEEPTSDFWTTQLPRDFMESAVKDCMPPPFDCVILDEAQDLMSDLYLECMDFLIRGGLKGGSWCLFGDFDNQDIYSAIGEPALDTLKALENRGVFFAKHTVRKNCRNSRRVASWLNSLDIKPPYSGMVHEHIKSEVKWLYWVDMPGQAALLEEAVGEVLKNYKPTDVVILSPKSQRPLISTCSSDLRQRCADYNSTDLRDRNKIRTSSIAAFKGLEARVVMLTDIETMSERGRALLYVGMSRARLMVWVFANKRLKSEIRVLSRL
jgi:hypothetical protein